MTSPDTDRIHSILLKLVVLAQEEAKTNVENSEMLPFAEAAIEKLLVKAVVTELESLIKGQYVSDFTKRIQARANELKGLLATQGDTRDASDGHSDTASTQGQQVDNSEVA